jgi:hypothetical protein
MNLAVEPIPPNLARPWLLERHYAKRIPLLSFIYGLWIDHELQGVCTFGPPPRQFNDGYGLFAKQLVMPTYELNRLVVGDDMPPNTLSRFVAGALAQLPRPMAVVSYADPNHGHHGFIYQATNWLYLGPTAPTPKFMDPDGKSIHRRTVVELFGTSALDAIPDWVQLGEQVGKHRYLKLLGSKTDRRRMMTHLAYEILPYPKGDNDRYLAAPVANQLALDLTQ